MGIFDFLSGGVGDLFGGIAGGLIGAAGAKQQAQAAIQAANINAQSAEQINQQSLSHSDYWNAINQDFANRGLNLQVQQASGDFMPAIGANIVKEANVLGVNPISLAGASPGSASFSTQVGATTPDLKVPQRASGASPGGAALEKMGAALQALDFGSKQDELKLKSLELDNVLKTQDIVQKQIVSSQQANMSQPGRSPVERVSGGANPLLQTFTDDYGNKFKYLSKPASESQMNWASTVMAPLTMYKLLESNLASMDWRIKKSDIPFSSVWNSDVQKIGNPAGD